jgi:hypothetical protein
VASDSPNGSRFCACAATRVAQKARVTSHTARDGRRAMIRVNLSATYLRDG